MRRFIKLFSLLLVVATMLLASACGNSKNAVSKAGNYYDDEAGVSVERYGNHVYFVDCDKTTPSYTLPTEYENNLIKNVAKNAMSNNEILVELTIPDGYEDIGHFAFSGCENLEKVHIGKNVSSIWDFAFSKCPKLTAFTVSADNKYLYEKDGCVLTKNTDALVATNGKIPDGTRIIGSAVFSGNKNLSNIVIPDSIDAIKSFAFENSSLESVTIGKNVTTIQKYAFSECDSLKEVYIPANVTELGAHIFGGIDTIVINCEAESKPDGWDDEWSVGCANITVNWGVKK